MQLEAGAIVLNGNPGLTLSSEFTWSPGQQTRPLRVTQIGALTWTRDDGDGGTCEVSLITTSDLAAHQRAVQGTLCGFPVRQETAWAPGGG